MTLCSRRRGKGGKRFDHDECTRERELVNGGSLPEMKQGGKEIEWKISSRLK